MPEPDSERSAASDGIVPQRAGWRRILFRTVLAVAVSAAFIALLLAFVPFEAFLPMVAAASPELLLLSLGCFVLAQIARGWRIAVLVSPRTALTYEAYRISTLHNFLAALLPARLGELALPVMLKRSYGIGLLEGTVILLGARILDLLVILVVCGLTYWIVLPDDSPLAWSAELGLAGGLAAAAAFAVMFWLRVVCARLADRLSRRLEATDGTAGLWRRLLGILIKVLAACGALPARRLFLAQVSTLAVWAGLFGCFYLGTLAATGRVPLDVSLFASTLASIAFVLPVNGIAQVGPFEAAWVFGAGLAGAPAADALAAAVIIHAVTFVGGLLQAAFVMLVAFFVRDRKTGHGTRDWFKLKPR